MNNKIKLLEALKDAHDILDEASKLDNYKSLREYLGEKLNIAWNDILIFYEERAGTFIALNVGRDNEEMYNFGMSNISELEYRACAALNVIEKVTIGGFVYTKI